MAKTILVQFKGEDNVSKTAQNVEKSVQRVGAQSTIMGRNVVDSSQKATKALTDLGSQYRYMSLVAGLAAAGTFMLAKSFVTAAREFQDAQLKLGVFAASAGEDMDKVNKAAQDLYSTGLVPMTQASEAFANLLATGMGIDKATNLLNTFLDSAVVAKENINDTYGDALVKASLGVRIFAERQIDAIGINTQLNKVFVDYAKSIGTVSTSLTNAQKWQAIYNFYMHEGQRTAGSAELATQTLTGALSKLSANLTIMRATLGNALVPAVGAFSDGLKSAASAITDFADRFPAVTSMLIIGTTVTVTLTAALAGLGALIPLVSTGISGLKNIMLLFNAAALITALEIAVVAAAVGALVYIVLKATGQWDKWMNSMKTLGQRIAATINPFKQLGDTLDENNDKLAKQLKTLQQNITLASRDFKEGMAEWSKDHDKTVTDLKKQILDLEKTYSKATSKIKDDFSGTMRSLSTDHARKTEDIQRQLEEEISKGVWADQTRIRDLQRELKRENEDYSAAIAEKTDARDKDLADEKETHDTKLAELQAKLDEELALEKKHAVLVAEARTWPILDEIEKRTRAYTERLNQYADELSEVKKTAAGEAAAYDSVAASLKNVQTELDFTAMHLTNPQTAAQVLVSDMKRVVAEFKSAETAASKAGIAAKGVLIFYKDSLIGAMRDTATFLTQLGSLLVKLDQAAGRLAGVSGGRGLVQAGLENFAMGTNNFINGLLGLKGSYAEGGVIPGSPSTPVPILAHGGETVLPAGVAPVTVNIMNPVVRSDSDLRRLAEMVKQVLADDQRYRHVT